MKQYKTILVALMFTFCSQLVAEDLKATSKGKLRNKPKESAIKVSGDWIEHYEAHSNPSINYRLMKPFGFNEKKIIRSLSHCMVLEVKEATIGNS